MNSVIVVAAGASRRMGIGMSKIYLPIEGMTVLEKNIRSFLEMESLAEIVIVVAEDMLQDAKDLLAKMAISIPFQVVLGGNTRQGSVWNGVQALQYRDIVLVHDGARPFASKDLFNKVAVSARKEGAAIPVIPLKDTVKVIAKSYVETTLDRSSLGAVQTPQAFQYDVLWKAHHLALQKGYEGTDDASLVELMGSPVVTVDGEEANIKITTQEDALRSGISIPRKACVMRVGLGYDVHVLAPNRPCVLGGVSITSDVGPVGHSDADVLIHALMDALLGAAGLRDIGYYFPPSDDKYKGIASTLLLDKVMHLIQEAGYSVHNVDCMLIAEVPKVSSYIDKMKNVLCQILQIDDSYMSIKATTNEGLGAIGRREGIAAQVVVTIREREA